MDNKKPVLPNKCLMVCFSILEPAKALEMSLLNREMYNEVVPIVWQALSIAKRQKLEIALLE